MRCETDRDEAREALREALLSQEAACAPGVPPFAQIVGRIESAPSPLDATGWNARKSARLAAALAASQVRVVPRAVLPAALVLAGAAVAGACLIASLGVAMSEAAWCFSAFLLFGAALTVSLALSAEPADALALATPLGPQAVVLARLATVLGLDMLAAVAGSAAFAATGSSPGFAPVVATWLAPLALVAGASAFAAVWSDRSWTGATVGAALVPFAMPAAQTASEAATALVGSVGAALGPAGLVALGAALLAAAVCSSRRAALARLQAV